MLDCKLVNTPMDVGAKLSKIMEDEDEEKVDSTMFKSLVRSSRYLTCTWLDILFGVGIVSCFMEAKRILCSLKGTFKLSNLILNSHDGS